MQQWLKSTHAEESTGMPSLLQGGAISLTTIHLVTHKIPSDLPVETKRKHLRMWQSATQPAKYLQINQLDWKTLFCLWTPNNFAAVCVIHKTGKG